MVKKQLKKMDCNRLCLVLCVLALVVAICVGLCLYRKYYSKLEYFYENNEAKRQKQVVQRLRDGGWKMYGSEGCGFCHKQRELFGDNFVNVEYVDCDKNDGLCGELGVVGYPTWHNGSRSESGFKTLEELEVMMEKN